MVHTGKPSRGCEVCRRRRIKCDEKLPECSYCVKTKQKCPGYKDLFDLAWRDQTTVAQKSVERRKRAGEKALLQEENVKSTNALQGFMSPLERTFTQPTCQLSNDLLQDLGDNALNFWFDNYASSTYRLEKQQCFTEYVPGLVMKSALNSTLRMSTLAVASCLFIAWSDRNPDSALTRSFYLKALSAMKLQLETPVECANNEMIMSVLLLQMYETLIGVTRKLKTPRAHLRGAMALIKHRGMEDFQDETSRAILLWVRYLLVEEAFQTGQPLQADLKDWHDISADAVSPINAHLDQINLHLANLQASTHQQATPKSAFQISQVEATVQKANHIDRLLIDWCNTIQQSWHPVRVSGNECIPASVREAGLYQTHCHIFSNIHAANYWNRQRISRIRVQVIKLGQLSLLPTSIANLTSIAAAKNTIQQLADDICASVPTYLGDRTNPGLIGDKAVQYPHLPGSAVPDAHYQMATAHGGYQLLSPLATLLGMKINLRVGQKQWIGGQMMRLARIYNLGK